MSRRAFTVASHDTTPDGFEPDPPRGDRLPRVPVACAAVTALAAVLAAFAGDVGAAVLCLVITSLFGEVAVLRREVQRERERTRVAEGHAATLSAAYTAEVVDRAWDRALMQCAINWWDAWRADFGRAPALVYASRGLAAAIEQRFGLRSAPESTRPADGDGR